MAALVPNTLNSPVCNECGLTAILNPYQITPNASINRVKIVSAPNFPAALSGKTAYELLGRHVIVPQIVQRFPDLANLPDPLPEFERRYLTQDDPDANAIARQMGLSLSWLLFTLKQGDPINRAARPQWDDSYWTHWAGIERVVVGGGMVAGVLGQRLINYARIALGDLLSLEIARHAAVLPLLGAALKTDQVSDAALTFDFGGTALKGGVMCYAEQKLLRFPSVLLPQSLEPVDLLEVLTNIVVDSWRVAQPYQPAHHVTASIANYVKDCRLNPDTTYGQLLPVGGNGCDLIAAEVSRKLGVPLTVSLLQDGAAAAYVYAGASKTAVITIGTALGIGFPPPRSTFRLSDRFFVQDI